MAMVAIFSLYYIKFMKNNKLAFTLVEMSIAISIIAFIIGGVFIANNIKETGKLHGFIKEIDTIKAALVSFKSIYGYYPGDFPGASNLWCSAACPGTSGVAANCVPGGADGTTAGYCNGNGNGAWDYNGGLVDDERVRAWQHLSLAGLVPGSYTGVETTQWVNDSTNTFLSKVIPAAGYSFYNVHAYTGSINFAAIIGGAAAQVYSTAIFASPFVFKIDNKIDDAIPNTGVTRATGVCAISTTTPYTYDSAAASLCKIYYAFDG